MKSIYRENPNTLVKLDTLVAYSWQTELIELLDTLDANKILWYIKLCKGPIGSKTLANSMATFNNCLHLEADDHHKLHTMLTYVVDSIKGSQRFKAIIITTGTYVTGDLIRTMSYIVSATCLPLVILSTYLPPDRKSIV